MAETSIEWAHKTWNPVTGCSKVSEGCAHCYGERMAKRLAGRYGYPKDKPFAVTSHPDKIYEPLHWREPKTIFVCSMGDLFHEDVPFLRIATVFGVMHTAKQHRYLLLTKRPQRMKEFFEWFTGPFWRGAWPEEYGHVWLGVTAENQQRVDERIPILLQIPAAVHFVSYEPALGPIDFSKWVWRDIGWQNAGGPNECPHGYAAGVPCPKCTPRVDLIIAGGETGPGARPPHPNYFRQTRDQCKEAGVPFFFKGWGDWCPSDQEHLAEYLSGTAAVFDPPGTMRRVGKKRAGRLLDGVEHNEFPLLGR